MTCLSHVIITNNSLTKQYYQFNTYQTISIWGHDFLKLPWALPFLILLKIDKLVDLTEKMECHLFQLSSSNGSGVIAILISEEALIFEDHVRS